MMNSGLNGRVVMLVGVGRPGAVLSNGRATASAFADAGARLALVDNSQESLDECADDIRKSGETALAVLADITQEAQVRQAVDSCLAQFGRIDVLHFNVAIPQFGRITRVSAEEVDRVFAINVKSAVLLAKHVLPVMESQNSGVITHVSSVSGLRHIGVSSPLYDMSKAALGGLTRHIAVQYGPKGIRANTLVLGMLDTPLAREAISQSGRDLESIYESYLSKIPAGRMGQARDVAEAAIFLASDSAGYINGAEIVVDGGLIQKAG
jgi:NAD(P)-dependent dehydrogenase (short-subunit alcohol dehydrogenase family)